MVSTADERACIRMAALLAGGGRRARKLVADAGPRLSVAGLDAVGSPRPWLDEVVRKRQELERVHEKLGELGWRWLTPESTEWPPVLDSIADPPLGLFVRGRLGGPLPAAAIVGSRRATGYGRRIAHDLAAAIAEAGGVVVSGMARGVDGAAHRGALESGGATWAVWGSGPDRVYPPEHRRLADAIAERGALLTEYPPGAPPRAGHFPERNRLIAGLVRAVVVVQAAARSGALATARLALDEGRDVLAVPGDIDRDVSVGPNGLLRAGAIPCTMAGDLLDVLGLERAPSARRSEPEDPVVAAIGDDEAVSADDLAHRTGQSVQEIQLRLFELEVSGRIARRADGLVERRS